MDLDFQQLLLTLLPDLVVVVALFAATASAAPTDQSGTAANPYLGPEPEGIRASQLVSVVSETYGDTALVELVGDGTFSFPAFKLEDPARFVMDLPGVVKTTEQGRVPVEHDIVAQVRLAQYRSYPEPISRVVFDLLSPAVPRIENTPQGLAVSFGADPDRLRVGMRLRIPPR